MRINFTLSLILCCIYAHVHGQAISKLTAQANYSHDMTGYIPEDSSVYIYTSAHQRGSDMKTGLYLFDTSVRDINTGSGLMQGERFLRTYEDAAAVRIQTETKQKFINNAWENNQRTTYHYPAAMGSTNYAKKDTILLENWNNLSVSWRNLSRTSITYNSNKDVTEELVEKYNDLSKVWENDRITINMYAGTKLNTRQEKEWDLTSSNWINVQQNTYTYSGANLTKEVLETWNTTTNTWDKSQMIDYAYNISGVNTSKTYRRWDPGTSAWALMQKNDYEYIAGNLTSDTLSSWDKAAMQWVQNWLYTYTYNSAKNLTSAMIRTPGPDSFLYYRRQEWSYNSYDQPTTFVATEWDFTSKSWLPMNGPKVLSNYYYTLFTVGVKNVANNSSFNIFPVPAQSIFSISLAQENATPLQIALYDMRGSIIKQWGEPATKNYIKSVPVSDLPEGLYIIKVNAGNKEMTKTLSIQR